MLAIGAWQVNPPSGAYRFEKSWDWADFYHAGGWGMHLRAVQSIASRSDAQRLWFWVCRVH